ncbi:RES family NAD+ phosphorylase [Vibrio splendidus]
MSKQLSTKIRKLRLLDLETVSYEELIGMVRELVCLASGVENIKSASTVVCSLRKGERLFRAHFKHTDERQTLSKTPTYLKSILAPPASLVEGYQRCNAPNKPMFYAATCPERALRECRVSKGDILFLSEWEVTADMTTTVVSAGVPDPLTSSHELLFNFFADKFIQRVHDTFSFEYKLTAAITQVLLEIKRKDEALTGICYPSVVSKKRGDNFAILPSFQALLKPVKVEKISIVEESPSEYGWVTLESVSSFVNQRINWRSFEQKIIAPSNIPIVEQSSDDIGHYVKLANGALYRSSIASEHVL